MTRQPLRTMPPAELDKLRDVVAEHDPDVVAIFVLHGSEDRGLAFSGWSIFGGEDAMDQALSMMIHAVVDEEKFEVCSICKRREDGIDPVFGLPIHVPKNIREMRGTQHRYIPGLMLADKDITHDDQP